MAPAWAHDPALGQAVFLGFMTPDVRKAAEALRAGGVQIVRDVQHHDWGGTDVIIGDADGNAVQVYQLDRARRYGSLPGPVPRRASP